MSWGWAFFYWEKEGPQKDTVSQQTMVWGEGCYGMDGNKQNPRLLLAYLQANWGYEPCRRPQSKGRNYSKKRQRFLEHLKENKENVWVQMDNATTHNLVMRELINCTIPLMNWPPNSPDLNPIENVWSVMNKIVQKKFG